MHEKIVILDFGGQYAHLIASRVRRQNVLAEIHNPDEVKLKDLQDKQVKGIILSGGPQSVYDEESIRCNPQLFSLGKPMLGICYGHQYLSHSLGGEVTPGEVKEYGWAELNVTEKSCPLFKDIPKTSTVWMSHGDEVTTLPKGFAVCGKTKDCAHAAVWNKAQNTYGIQFHPEVTHTEYGHQILANFLEICAVSYDWTIEKFIEEETEKLKQQVGKKNIFLFVSGGVDSSVSLAFLTQIFGKKRVKGLFVDTGLMRKNEVKLVEKSLKDVGADLTVLHEADRFLWNLKDIYEPEHKRKIIGHTFLDVQQDFFTEHDLHGDWLLAQGTIYPDTIETGGTKHASTIKTHHNRAPEVQKLIDQGKIVEPIKELYKDEVRQLGEALGLPHQMVWRHPFPGPGLGVRILCNEEPIHQVTPAEINPGEDEVGYIILPVKSVGVQGDFRTYRHPAVLFFGPEYKGDIQTMEWTATDLINAIDEVNRCLVLIDKNFPEDVVRDVAVEKASLDEGRVKILQKADDIVTKTLQKMKLYEAVWQFPTVLVPLVFNGVGTESVILRPINSIDAMSASVGQLPWEFFEKVAAEILKDKTISAVFLDVTSKPPGTIEWE